MEDNRARTLSCLAIETIGSSGVRVCGEQRGGSLVIQVASTTGRLGRVGSPRENKDSGRWLTEEEDCY